MRRQEYTHEERQCIIQYIIDNDKYSSLRGNSMWKEMEEENILPRTWQSMKQHFKTKIFDQLHLFNITPTERKKIKDGYMSTSTKRQSKIDGRIIRLPVKRRTAFSSDEETPTKIKNENKKTPVKINSDIETISSNSNSPDLLAEVPSVNKNQKFSLSPSQKIMNAVAKIQNVDNSAINIESDSENEVTVIQVHQQKKNSNCSEPFSADEDHSIINFFKMNPTYLSQIHDEDMYTLVSTKCSLPRSCKSLKNRFVDYILPNLYKFELLSHAEMISFYDQADMEIPENLQSIIDRVVCETSAEKSSKTDATTSTDYEIKSRNVGIQVEIPSDDESTSDPTKSYLSFTVDDINNIFIPKNNLDNSTYIKKLPAESRVCFVDLKSFSFLSRIKNVQSECGKTKEIFENYLKDKSALSNNCEFLSLLYEMKEIIKETMSEQTNNQQIKVETDNPETIDSSSQLTFNPMDISTPIRASTQVQNKEIDADLSICPSSQLTNVEMDNTTNTSALNTSELPLQPVIEINDQNLSIVDESKNENELVEKSKYPLVTLDRLSNVHIEISQGDNNQITLSQQNKTLKSQSTENADGDSKKCCNNSQLLESFSSTDETILPEMVNNVSEKNSYELDISSDTFKTALSQEINEGQK